MTRYVPSRHYLQAGVAALVFAVFSAWCGWRWSPPAFAAAALFLASATVLLFLSFRPRIEIEDTHLSIGKRRIPWNSIRRVDRTGWVSPMMLNIEFADNSRTVLIYPGDLDSANSLLRHIRLSARQASIDGIPYTRFWGKPASIVPESKPLAPPPYRLLLPEDEAEVERLYQRLKAVRYLDPDNFTDDK
ncbi:MAG: DUF3093 family protein [Bryobacteraceae bacterium]